MKWDEGAPNGDPTGDVFEFASKVPEVISAFDLVTDKESKEAKQLEDEQRRNTEGVGAKEAEMSNRKKLRRCLVNASVQGKMKKDRLLQYLEVSIAAAATRQYPPFFAFLFLLLALAIFFRPFAVDVLCFFFTTTIVVFSFVNR